MSAKTYRIKSWGELYENNRTRELKRLDWFPMPNKQDGDGYTLIIEMKNGAAIFGAWVACAQVASRCDPRGTLLRDGKKPHDSCSLSRMTRIPQQIIEEMLEAVSHPDVNWLEVIDLESGCEIPAEEREIPATGCLEGKGREGKGKKGMEPVGETEKAVIDYLNQKAGTKFEVVNGNVSFIRSRMKEGATLDQMKSVIDDRVNVWGSDLKMRQYLRPSTLFNSEKYPNYVGLCGAAKPPTDPTGGWGEGVKDE